MQRTQSYVPNQQVLDAELNAIQDRAVGGGKADANNAHTTLGDGQDVVMWMYDTAEILTGTMVKVSGQRSYLDRILTVHYTVASSSDQWPGSANDNVFDYTVPVRMGYTGKGALGAASAAVANGTPPVPAGTTSWALQIGTNIWLFAVPVTGELYLYNDSGAPLRTPILTVFASATTGKRP